MMGLSLSLPRITLSACIGYLWLAFTATALLGVLPYLAVQLEHRHVKPEVEGMPCVRAPVCHVTACQATSLGSSF